MGHVAVATVGWSSPKHRRLDARWGHPGDEHPGYREDNARGLGPAREDLLDSPAEAMVFLRDILDWLIKRRICVSFDFTRRNPLDVARGHRLCGLSGAPPRTAVPPLRWLDQPRSPPTTSEIAIAMAPVAVVLPLRLGGSRTPRPGSWSAGSASRSWLWVPVGSLRLRGHPDLPLELGQSEWGGRRSTGPSVRV